MFMGFPGRDRQYVDLFGIGERDDGMGEQQLSPAVRLADDGKRILAQRQQRTPVRECLELCSHDGEAIDDVGVAVPSEMENGDCGSRQVSRAKYRMSHGDTATPPAAIAVPPLMSSAGQAPDRPCPLGARWQGEEAT